MFTTFVPIAPYPAARPRVPKRGPVYYPAKHRDCKAHLELFFRDNKPSHPFIVPLIVSLTFNLKKPKSVSREHPSVRPDLDNYAKLILDVMSGHVYLDDGQICKLILEKKYSDVIGTFVAVSTF